MMSQFVDECGVNVRGGDGGAGCVSFRREAHVSRGGPDGGDGGRGGSVWFVADVNVASLLAFRDHPHRRADKGVHGQGAKKHGRRGEDLDVRVPVGTVVRARDGGMLADLANAGDRYQAAVGGVGGKGNARFLSNKRRAPAFAEQGEMGAEDWLRLELKLVADVALVGFPNAGKSTLISRISAAKPKIADYPFTTLEPNLGVVRLDEGDDMVVADIPGLIEGASEGRGLGHQFLRHVERARVLVVMADLAAIDGSSPTEQVEILLDELGSYQPELLTRPRLLVGTKADVATGEPLDGMRVISAVTGSGLPELVGAMTTEVRLARVAQVSEIAPTIHRPVGEDVEVERTDDGWVVLGRAAARAVSLSDLTDPDAVALVQGRLAGLGVDRQLARAGAREGDTVHIGDLEFTYDESGFGGTGG
jgi:GTP-binding protein